MLRWVAHAAILSAALLAIGVGTIRVDAGRVPPNGQTAAFLSGSALEPAPQPLQRVDQAPPADDGAGEPAFTQRVERWRSLSMHATRVVHTVTGVSVDHDLLLALIAVESSGDPDARSAVGAVGLAQVEPSTFVDLQSRYRDVLGKSRLEDPSTNVLAGALYLADCARVLHADLGDPAGLNLVLDAYNLGPRAAAEWHATGAWFHRSEVERSLPAETVQHAERIITAYQRAHVSLPEGREVDGL